MSKIKNLELKNLGYSASQIKLLNEIIIKPVGSLIICGEKESGLKTTLNSLLKKSTEENKGKKFSFLNHRNLNEKEDFYKKNNILKMTVFHEKDDTTESAQAQSLKILMRKDRDFIFIDELKKGTPIKEYRKICQSGYSITATMKSKSNIDLITQLKDSGFKKEYFSDIYLLNIIMNQCLMPKVCKKCGININNFLQNENCEKEKVISFLKKIEQKYLISDFSNILIRNKEGCIDCNHIGIKDMTVCAELIDLNNEMRYFLIEDKVNEFYESYRKLSDKNLHSENFQGKNILEHALYKMLKGIICPLDIMKKFEI